MNRDCVEFTKESLLFWMMERFVEFVGRAVLNTPPFVELGTAAAEELIAPKKLGPLFELLKDAFSCVFLNLGSGLEFT